jgi:hypothetical protein
LILHREGACRCRRQYKMLMLCFMIKLKKSLNNHAQFFSIYHLLPCCVFHTAQKINNRSVTFFQRYTYLCFSYNKDIFINVRTFRLKCYQSRDFIYPVLKGSAWAVVLLNCSANASPLSNKTTAL